ncbi:hypothetical protein [Taibaiella chishuiensis]|uniref:Uncharacterized protein n=1 Tax=Taibaiella chishuiensis TaxID=1434707 RepID=A0A2P8DDM8_9BACT|nr:hypothetical protein [Taibaiella chishuiensis]PSK95295.1 hypothetical protein B0I18_1011461 [Taibaiella chishuiensis]
MQKKYLTLLTCLNVAGIFSGNICFGQSPAPNPAPHVLVYKMRKDYSKQVPVILSADKKEIVSYPDPVDLGSGMEPVKLKGNYWLDNRGIGADVAFLKLTYKQYAALKKAPSEAELKGMILDASPLKELCDCGPKSAFKQAPAQQLNTWITSGKLRRHCKTIRK